MNNNYNLNKARANKQDEFYTKIETIQKELPYYDYFFKKDISIYCNCDTADSNFVKYFNGKRVTHYAGDFRSKESIDLLRKADVVVTNPPFSLFREYIQQLMDYNKKFLILGHMNGMVTKSVFEYAKQNKIWFGKSIRSGDTEFQVPDYYEITTKLFRVDEQGRTFIKVPGVRWFTNISTLHKDPFVILDKPYDPELYPKYDNYDAINVNVSKDIPNDYYGNIGAPVSFLSRRSHRQFHLVDLLSNPILNGKNIYKRVIIKRR